MLLAMYQATTVYFLSKTVRPVLLVLSTVCDTPIQRYLWFVQGTAFAMRERNETPFFYAQMKTRNYTRRRNGPTGRNQLGATRRVKDN